MIELAFLLFEISSRPPELTWVEPIVCDNGTSPHHEGAPNWSCTLNGCAPEDSSCGDENLDHCFDVAGNDLGFCDYDVEVCKSHRQCFDTWLYCPGTWKCLDTTSSVGCNHGTCTTDTGDPPAPEPNFDLTEARAPRRPPPAALPSVLRRAARSEDETASETASEPARDRALPVQRTPGTGENHHDLRGAWQNFLRILGLAGHDGRPWL